MSTERRKLCTLIIHDRIGNCDIMLIFFPGFQLATGKQADSYSFSTELEANLLHDDFRQSLVV